MNTPVEHENNNDKLFFKVWKNIYIRMKIVDHLKRYNLYHCTKYILDVKDLTSVEAQNYRSIDLIFSHRLTKEFSILEILKLLPDSVVQVKFDSMGFREPLNLIEAILPTVTSLDFSSLIQNYQHSQITGPIPGGLKTLTLGTPKFNKIEFGSTFQQSSLTYLDIGTFINGSGLSTLPNTLRTFKCKSGNLKSFNIDSLSLVSSITHLDFNGSNLSKFTITNSNNGKLEECSLSSLVNLVYLNLGQSFDQKIKVGYLPTRLKTLKLSNTFDTTKRLKPLSIPSSVTELVFDMKISSYSGKMIKVDSNILPLSLVKLKLGPNHWLKSNDDKDDNLLSNFNEIVIHIDTHNKCKVIPKTIKKLKVNGSDASISIPNHIESILINGRNITIINFNQLTNLTFIKIGMYSNFSLNNLNIPSMESKLITLSCGNQSLNNNDVNRLFQSVRSLSTLDYQFTCNAYPSLTLLELNNKNSSINTQLLPSTVHTLIIINSLNIILPISPNIKTIFLNYSSNQHLLKKLNISETPHLLNIFKVVDIPKPSSKLFVKLSQQ